MDNVKLFSVFAGLAVVAGLVAGAVVLHFAPQSVRVIQSGASPAGTTFNTAKTAMIVFSPISDTASTTSIFNAEANDRIIKQVQFSCTGANFTAATSLAQVTLSAATTAVSSLGLQANPRVALSNTLATSTSEVWTATTTTATPNRRWNSGSYLTFATNATSTGLSCVIGVDYIGT
jgi:hypothetical protein